MRNIVYSYAFTQSPGGNRAKDSLFIKALHHFKLRDSVLLNLIQFTCLIMPVGFCKRKFVCIYKNFHIEVLQG
jgi:hypothetical protein